MPAIERGPRPADAPKSREIPAVDRPLTLADLDDRPWREAMTFWSRDHRERFEERAAILEFVAGLFREEAERRAFLLLVTCPQHFEPEERGLPAVEPRSISIPADHWRWRVANWPQEAWLVWHRLVNKLLTEGRNETPFETQERAYRQLEALAK